MTMIANTFGINQCTLTKVVKEVCSVIVTYMVPKLIKLTNSQSEMLFKISEFEAKFGMPQAFDYKGYFMDFDCRWPGDCHDPKVYGNSSINRKIQHKEIPIIYKQIIPGEAKIGNYLTDDPAYPLTLFCMK